MHPADAARQLQYAVASETNTYDYEVSHWEAHAYEDVFADVIEQGELSDVMAVVETLGNEFTEESRPSPARARSVADDVLKSNGRPLTDGGERTDE
ncbi:hypothetical protein GL213_06820 [Halogeometricum borinquense]|uniref:Uncharacterized protein n=2 Tax=Halogeometricum borinquense TaxID=60847 RepID=E4NSF9_HALBP|nr:hypothetical protein [Halogeometricum borinquense]ADQ66948.1 hypothetical protein Hbor_13670 [Halogeometricum borinquense DSM 11551]ELY30083.1 hypothetical protein C499_04289 [Halogeometricum borinquense DSM 11551]QIB74796.1 hypothetical protein G3I44_11185 [Halogeometricum borinquense]QIQ76256.1 hypothetical protein GL213_06820 [Halogeometricum borinquense]RYJ14079.1 hypothetical protein ELS19_08925 [Halogeometricum borinquense]